MVVKCQVSCDDCHMSQWVAKTKKILITAWWILTISKPSLENLRPMYFLNFPLRNLFAIGWLGFWPLKMGVIRRLKIQKVAHTTKEHCKLETVTAQWAQSVKRISFAAGGRSCHWHAKTWWGRIVPAELSLPFCDGWRPAYSAVPKSGRMVSVV